MRGRRESQTTMLSLVAPEQRVPQAHPLRRIKQFADAALKTLSPTFDARYSAGGRPSVPPEGLLRATLLMAFYSVRSDRLFCGQLATTCSSAGSSTWTRSRSRSTTRRSRRTDSGSLACGFAERHGAPGQTSAAFKSRDPRRRRRLRHERLRRRASRARRDALQSPPAGSGRQGLPRGRPAADRDGDHL